MRRSDVQAGQPNTFSGATTLAHRTSRLARDLVSRLTLVQRFALVSLAILLAGAFIIGRYVAEEIKNGVISRTTAITVLYVDSFVSPNLQELGHGDVPPASRAELENLLMESSLGQEIASFKVWNAQGEIVYARDPNLIGQRFEPQGKLSAALRGEVRGSISDLEEEENSLERQSYNRLLETYAPIREHETGAIIGAMEFYQDPSDLESEISSSQRNGWIIVGVSTAGMYLLLVGLVKGASNTLARQNRDMGRLAQDNARLAQSVRKAAAEKTETDEQLLMRIAHDLHDGPAQDLSLALLRIQSLRLGTEAHVAGEDREAKRVRDDFDLVETALASALKEVRDISSDLRLPEVQELTLPEVIEKAKLDHEHKTGTSVALDVNHIPLAAGLPLKITVYRVIQEALNNAYHHADGKDQRVRISHSERQLTLEIADSGPGFDPAAAAAGQEPQRTLGLRGMRERVEMLGGSLEIDAGPERHTTVRVRLPLEA